MAGWVVTRYHISVTEEYLVDLSRIKVSVCCNSSDMVDLMVNDVNTEE